MHASRAEIRIFTPRDMKFRTILVRIVMYYYTGGLVTPTAIALSQQLEKSGCCYQESYVQLIVRSVERTELVYMHVLHARFGNFYRSDCNVHRFSPVVLKLGKIKIVKYSSAICWPILCNCKVHFFFWQHCSSCNINFPSVATNKPQKWIHTIFIAIHPYNLVTGIRKKAVASKNAWFI